MTSISYFLSGLRALSSGELLSWLLSLEMEPYIANLPPLPFALFKSRLIFTLLQSVDNDPLKPFGEY